MTGKSSRLVKKPAQKAKKSVQKKEVKEEIETVEDSKVEEIKSVERTDLSIEKTESDEKKEDENRTKPLKSVSPSKVVPKRRGLKIIKKKKPKVENVETAIENIV